MRLSRARAGARRRYDRLVRSSLLYLTAVCAALLGVDCSGSVDGTECKTSGVELYHDRIEPLLRPSSTQLCNQCHLSGVDLSSFVRATPCETMACLKNRGLVDLHAPEQSKILSWILRASPDSKLITPEVIQAEHDGFLQWIEATASCPSECAHAKCGDPTAASSCDIGKAPDTASHAPATFDCSPQAVEQLFYDDVYRYRDRCYPCHFSSETHADARAPRWIADDANCVTSSAESLRVVEQLGLMNLSDPPQSLLLLKPLAVAAGGLPHGGDDKFEDTEDTAYRSFLDFITHYAECQAAH